MPRRRLEAEAIRDSILAVSGGLDLKMGGTLFTEGYSPVDAKRQLFTVDISGGGDYAPFGKPRRSIYLPMIRNSLPPMLRLFDAANEHEPTTLRRETTVAPQALFMLNSPFCRRQALAFSRRVLAADGDGNDGRRVHLAYLTALGRPPTAQETSDALGFLDAYVKGIDPDGDLRRAALEHRQSRRTPSPGLYRKRVDATSGLVAPYRFNDIDPGSDTVANPATGGRAALLNGVDQRIEVGDTATLKTLNALTDSISVEYWIRPAAVKLGMVIGRDDLAGGRRYWKSGVIPRDVDGESKNVVFHEFFGPSGFRTGTDRRFVAEVDTWTHVVFTFEPGRRQLFVNGELADSLVVDGSIPTGDVPLTIGSRFDKVEWFFGAVSEIAIYDRALDETTVREHLEAAGGRRAPPRPSPRELAWRSLCQTVLCMNEFVYVE